VKNEDTHLFLKAIKIAKEYFADSASFDKSANEVFGHE